MKEEHLIMEETKNLIDGCVRGDRHSQTSLYNLLSKKMFVVCLRYSKNREEAEEILQEGFMKVFQFIHQYKATGSFEGWVRKIMMNCALQKYRSQRHLHAVVSIDFVSLDNMINDENIFSKIGTKELLLMVQKLSPAYRMVFNLYVFEGLKHREIAQLLNISEGTSKSNLSDARSLLQKAISNSLQSSQNLLQI
ncbi:MAG TPA: RNA polymerase sigma factor [Hanamia sp.]|nr:RNA polymerase sigma factor [Hanamia sp.]